ncbi:hypothetical protein F5Y19DRAFT_492959 [Xylariaceae sp. FL1651]|nr:hypothetical protein F5Y19DRAFT_492959 [Xylariaceae sp. FL1651]
MHSTKILFFAAAFAGTSLSQKSDAEFCSAYFTSFLSVILNEVPTTPAGILPYFPTVPADAPPLTTLDFASHAQELCAIATELPSSLLPDFKTYADQLLSFGKSHSSEHVAYVTDCSPPDEVASRSSYLEYVFTATGNFCAGQTPTPGGSPTDACPTPTPTVTSSYAGFNSTTTATTSFLTAAAAKPTGALLGAIAMGGVLDNVRTIAQI